MNKLNLWDPIDPRPAFKTDFIPHMEVFTLDTKKPKGAVLVCPGGGYSHRAKHEGEAIAKKFNEAGLHAFVVQYRVKPDAHPAPLEDAARAIRIIRFNSEKWKVDPDKIAVCGFSAGGHLAASLGLHHDKTVNTVDEIDKMQSKPNALILSYPVISSGKFANSGSFKNLLGENASENDLELLSLEKQINENTPPTFLWHAAQDQIVPVENSLMFASELSKHKVPFELHIYPNPGHGMGLATEQPNIATWFSLCIEWLRGMGWN